MPRSQRILDQAEKAIRGTTKKPSKYAKIEEWKKKYRDKGPVAFAKEVLRSPPNVPPHPRLGKRPKYIILSPDQEKLLNDLWKGARFIIIIAARGAGKTFVLAIYVLWRLCCFDNWSWSCMGGSMAQSDRIREYIEYWRRTTPQIRYLITKSTRGGRELATIALRNYSSAIFLSCSSTQTRGPHVNGLVIDEFCSGEEAGPQAQKAMSAAWWEVSTSPDVQVLLSSTAHYVFGTFMKFWNEYEEMGFKRYQWSIAKHVSTDDLNYARANFYRDKNPKSWIPNVWWVTQRNLELLRKTRTDDEWLTEALGGIGMGSGRMFRPDDLEACICRECDICEPYTQKCTILDKVLAKKLKVKTLPSLIDKLSHVKERDIGVDYGKREDPCASVVLGRIGEHVFVLYNEERFYMTDNETLTWVDNQCKTWSVDMICPDPSEIGLNERLGHIWREYRIKGSKGKFPLAVKDLSEAKSEVGKQTLVSNTKRHVENHLLHIPKKYEAVIKSLAGMSYVKTSIGKLKIKKFNDHSHDALTYALSEFYPHYEGELYKIKKRLIERLW